MFKESGDEGQESPPGQNVDDVLDEQLGEVLDDEGIDALLEVNGVGGTGSSGVGGLVDGAVDAASSDGDRARSPVATGASSSNQPLKDAVTPQKRHQEAMNLMMQGKRHLLVKDLHSAVNAFQEACRIMDETHGQLAAPCGDAYLRYGQALLELARSENQVLGMGGAAGGEEEDDDDDDDDDHDEDEKEKDSPDGGEEEEEEEEEPEDEDLEASAKEEIDGPSSKDKGKGPALKKKNTPAATEDGGRKGANAPEDDDEEEEEEEENRNPDEEEVTNLQLAWEMLELAKLVFLKAPETKEKQIKAADCFLTLGEVSLESEAYDAAVDDFNRCLDIQKRHLPEDDRYIAETYYQLGLTHSFAKDYKEARLHFRHAIKVLESRVGNCRRIVETAIAEKGGSREKALMDEQVYKAKEEIDDLKGLLPEIMAKYEDAREMEAEHSEASKAVKEASENLHRSPTKKAPPPPTSAAGSSSGSGTSGAAGASSSSSASTTAFTAPFPREEEETGARKITFGSASSASVAAPSGVSMIGVRRNLSKESSSKSAAAALSSSAAVSSSSSPFAAASSSIPTGAINDISSLVRRKRKPEEGATPATSAPTTNGSAGTATNGGADAAAASSAASLPNGVENVSNGDAAADSTPEAKRVKINGDA